jgi:ATP-binding cassette subfamily A (ABC1) protein 3
MLGELSRRSGCFAAIVFRDSSLTAGKKGTWNYTVRTDSALSGGPSQVAKHSNDKQRFYLPLRVAFDNVIANSNIIPNEYVFTTISEATQDDNVRKPY